MLLGRNLKVGVNLMAFSGRKNRVSINIVSGKNYIFNTPRGNIYIVTIIDCVEGLAMSERRNRDRWDRSRAGRDEIRDKNRDESRKHSKTGTSAGQRRKPSRDESRAKEPTETRSRKEVQAESKAEQRQTQNASRKRRKATERTRAMTA